MKLPDFYQLSVFNVLKMQMGVAADVYGNLSAVVRSGRLSRDELDKLTSSDGLELSSIEDLRILPDGTLAFKDSRVLLYIRDHTIYGNRSADPRFHVSNCSTLQEMLRKSRFQRYVVATRPNGEFKLNLIEGSRRTEEIRKLSVCQNCMDFLKFEGFTLQSSRAQRYALVQGFSLDRFFETYPKSLHSSVPDHTSDTAPVDDYAPGFSDTSAQFRREVDWQCQNPSCGVHLNPLQHRKYLHLHHLNGMKADDRPENLRVLCIACHADQPGHGHMKSMPDYKAFVALKPSLAKSSRTE